MKNITLFFLIFFTYNIMAKNTDELSNIIDHEKLHEIKLNTSVSVEYLEPINIAYNHFKNNFLNKDIKMYVITIKENEEEYQIYFGVPLLKVVPGGYGGLYIVDKKLLKINKVEFYK